MSYDETRSQQNSSRRARIQRRRDEQGQRRRKIQALATGGLVLGFGATATLAAWSDQATTSGTFSTGAFAVEADVGQGWSSTHEMQFEAALMHPGQSVYAPVALRSSPDTSVDGIVTVSGAAPQEGLAPYLKFRAITVEPTDTAAEVSCSVETFDTASAEDYLFGSATDYVTMSGETTAHTTQHLRSQQAETISYCFEVEFDAEAPNETQDISADYSWKFNAQSITE